MGARLPLLLPNMRIGLLGGSFDPPHEGHYLVARQALQQLQLDRLWCLVSPQNPHKKRARQPLATRLAATQKLFARAPRITALDIESQLGTQYSVELVTALQKRYPQTRFVWLIGADNMAQLHKWHRWRALMNALPLAIYPRPHYDIQAGLSLAAQTYAKARRPVHARARLADMGAPSWTLLGGRRTPRASRQLRKD